MAVDFISGFETRDFQEWSSTSGTPTIDTTTVRSGNASCKMTTNAQWIIWDKGSANANWAYRFAVYVDSTAGINISAVRHLALFRTSTALRGTVSLTTGTTPKLRLTIETETDTDGTTDFPFDQWVVIETSWNSDTDSVEVKMDGTVEITRSVTTLPADVREWRLTGFVAAEAEIAAVYYDDVRIDNVATQIGDGKIVGLFPNGNGSNGWDTGGFADVDDWITVVEDDTATQALSTGSPSSATDNVQNTSVYSIGVSDIINIVVAAGVLARGTGGASNHFLRITDHASTDDDSADLALAGSYAFKSFVSTLSMPTPTQLDSWEVGGGTTGARDLEATALGLMIDYTPAISTPDIPYLPLNQPYIERLEVVAY